METTPFWLDESGLEFETPTVERVDVAVIGAGITGCACALALARGGLRVRVHDARGIAEGASGRNGGIGPCRARAGGDDARAAFCRDGSRRRWFRPADAAHRPPCHSPLS